MTILQMVKAPCLDLIVNKHALLILCITPSSKDLRLFKNDTLRKKNVPPISVDELMHHKLSMDILYVVPFSRFVDLPILNLCRERI